jgi:hypothetical protein
MQECCGNPSGIQPLISSGQLAINTRMLQSTTQLPQGQAARGCFPCSLPASLSGFCYPNPKAAVCNGMQQRQTNQEQSEKGLHIAA